MFSNMIGQRHLVTDERFGQCIGTSRNHSRCYGKNVSPSPGSSKGYIYHRYLCPENFNTHKFSPDTLGATENLEVHANTWKYEVDKNLNRRDCIQANHSNADWKTNDLQPLSQCSNYTNDPFPAPMRESISNSYITPIATRDAVQDEVIDVSDDDDIEYTYMFDPFPLDSAEEVKNNTNRDRFSSVWNHEHPPTSHVLNLSIDGEFTSLPNHDYDENNTQDCLTELNGAEDVYNQTPSHQVYSEKRTMQAGYHQSCLAISSRAEPCTQLCATRNTHKASLPCYSCAVGKSNTYGCLQIRSNGREDRNTVHCVPVQANGEDLDKGWCNVNNYNLRSSQIPDGIRHNQLVQTLPNKQPAMKKTNPAYDYNNQLQTSSNNSTTKHREHKQNYFVQELHKFVPKQQLPQNGKQQCHNEVGHRTKSPKASLSTMSNNRTTSKDVHKDKGLHASLTALHSNCDRCKGCKRLNLKLKAVM